MDLFFSGMSLIAFAASGVFFLKFWKVSGDRFFLYFCIACWLLAMERIMLCIVPTARGSFRTPEVEASSWVYCFRLVAFVFILMAVIKKNRRGRSIS